MLTPEVAVEHLSVSPRPSSWARVEARPESSVLARLWNKLIMRIKLLIKFLTKYLEKLKVQGKLRSH